MGQMVTFLTTIFAPSINSLAQTQSSGKVRFDDVWPISLPEGHAVTVFFGSEFVCGASKYEKGSGVFPSLLPWRTLIGPARHVRMRLPNLSSSSLGVTALYCPS